MAGLAAHALSVGGFAAALAAFAVAAAVLVLLVFAAAATVAGASNRVAKAVQATRRR